MSKALRKFAGMESSYFRHALREKAMKKNLSTFEKLTQRGRSTKDLPGTKGISGDANEMADIKRAVAEHAKKKAELGKLSGYYMGLSNSEANATAKKQGLSARKVSGTEESNYWKAAAKFYKANGRMPQQNELSI